MLPCLVLSSVCLVVSHHVRCCLCSTPHWCCVRSSCCLSLDRCVVVCGACPVSSHHMVGSVALSLLCTAPHSTATPHHHTTRQGNATWCPTPHHVTLTVHARQHHTTPHHCTMHETRRDKTTRRQNTTPAHKRYDTHTVHTVHISSSHRTNGNET